MSIHPGLRVRLDLMWQTVSRLGSHKGTGADGIDPSVLNECPFKDDEQFEVDFILNHQDKGTGRRRKISYLVL